MTLVLPQNVVERLGLQTQGAAFVTYADERREERPLAGPVVVQIGNRSREAVVSASISVVANLEGDDDHQTRPSNLWNSTFRRTTSVCVLDDPARAGVAPDDLVDPRQADAPDGVARCEDGSEVSCVVISVSRRASETHVV